MPSLTACRHEIEELHDLFVRWYCGQADEDEFERLERALAESFALVSPDGTTSDRETVLEWIRAEYDSREGFDIEIRNVEPVFIDDERALVRYEEWQSVPTGDGGREETGRLSTALFESVESDSGADSAESDSTTQPATRWLYLQETWLDAPDS